MRHLVAQTVVYNVGECYGVEWIGMYVSLAGHET